MVRLVRVQSWFDAFGDGLYRHRARLGQHYAGGLRCGSDRDALCLHVPKKWDVGFTVNGFLAGLVAITCPCYWVSPTGAILLGGVAGVLVCLGVELLEWLRIDDPIGAVPVHGLCGIWGTLSLGLFACGKYGATGPTGADNSAPLAGLFYHGGFTLLKAQFIGSSIITLSTLSVALVLMYAVNLTGTLRVTEEGELYGLDLHEHGISAYPEYVISSLAAPAGMPKDLTVPHRKFMRCQAVASEA